MCLLPSLVASLHPRKGFSSIVVPSRLLAKPCGTKGQREPNKRFGQPPRAIKWGGGRTTLAHRDMGCVTALEMEAGHSNAHDLLLFHAASKESPGFCR